ncbi:permease prefix domain 1-containing protein [Deinococcus roseus]|uniref:DUF4179 domain-containing protein n=1 Tax=Deinococcus roseus TaxID=392414 RepID=A0ABQ2CVG4_9DEIO|nr:permease prefix domain 1-containing protein [Deinococcus roseus]GGJ24302.1 hypothetical protein GCM10008938_08080 [Deinococcus roseus]
MQKQIEQYLNRATRGLWGQKRQHIKQELYSHIYEKMHFQMAFGKSEQEALESALQSLGKPQELNAGLLKTHGLPAFGKALMVTALVGTLLVTQAQNLRTIEVFQKTPPCTSSNSCLLPQHYISLHDLTPLLQQLDITAEFRMEGLLQKAPQLYLNGENIHLPSTHLLGTTPENAAVEVSVLLRGLYINKNIKVSGLINPQIEMQNSRVKFENQTIPYDATDFYLSLIQKDIEDLTQTQLVFMNDEYTRTHSERITIKVPDAPDGEVYALLQKPSADLYDAQGKPLRALSMVLGEALNGKVALYTNPRELQPVSLKNAKTGDVFLRLSGDPAKPKYTEIFPNPEDIARHF